MSFLMPVAYRLQPSSHYLHRLMVMFLTCAPAFIMLTISYESLFYVAFCVTLFAWVRLEHQTFVFQRQRQRHSTAQSGKNSCRPLRLSDARVALFFFVLLQSAFFSTG